MTSWIVRAEATDGGEPPMMREFIVEVGEPAEPSLDRLAAANRILDAAARRILRDRMEKS